MTIRIPFLRIVTGKTARARASFLQRPVRKICPARTLVIKSAMLERMPLHSCATSMSTAGSRKMDPS